MKLLGLGDNVMDAYLFRGELYPGGNAANVSVLAKRAGAEESGYLGVLATDAAGEHFRAALQAENVDISRIRRGVGRTACNYITLDDHGDRIFSGNNGQETVQNLYRPIITGADRTFAAGFDVIHSSIHSGLDDALPALSHCADLSMDFSNDGFTHDNVTRLAPLLRFAFFSAGERSQKQAMEFAAFAAGCGVSEVIFTMGLRGACGISCGKEWYVPATPVDAVDALGAGDGFIAAFLRAFYDHGEDASVAAAEASKFAAKCCLHHGAMGHPMPIAESGLFPENTETSGSGAFKTSL